MKALNFSVLLLLVSSCSVERPSPELTLDFEAKPVVPGVAEMDLLSATKPVASGIRYYFQESPTPVHVVVMERSHREYEFRVLADEIGHSGLFNGHKVADLASTHMPAAIAAINGGAWICPLSPLPEHDPLCRAGGLPGELFAPTGTLVTNGDSRGRPPSDGEVIFDSEAAGDSGSQVSLFSGKDWKKSNSPHYYAVGMPPFDEEHPEKGDNWVMRGGTCESALKERDARSAIGYGDKYVVLISSNHKNAALKADIPDLCKIFWDWGVTEAMLLDGGGSAQMYVSGYGAPVNPTWRKTGARRVANAIGIVKVCNVESESCSGNNECCGGLTCQSGTCRPPLPTAVCGNGVCETGEACDGADLHGNTCSALGFDGGTLSCGGSCSFNTAGCCQNTCSGGTMCSGNVLLTCGNYDSDSCLEWGGAMTCPNGCSAGACQGPGPACTVISTQNFESISLFNDNVVGSQPFMVGTQQVGQFWDASTSRIRHGIGRSPSQYSLSLETHSSGVQTNTFVDFDVPAASNQTLRVSFYAYNPYLTSYDIVLARAGGPPVTKTVPSQEWTLISADLTSSISTAKALVFLGLIPNATGSFAFKMDDVVIERCTQ